jgi:hypothetical protein
MYPIVKSNRPADTHTHTTVVARDRKGQRGISGGVLTVWTRPQVEKIINGLIELELRGQVKKRILAPLAYFVILTNNAALAEIFRSILA